MPAFDLPLTVRMHPDVAAGRSAGSAALVVHLPGPAPWGSVADRVCAAAGLPAGTVLHLGPWPVHDAWVLGRPPLLAGVVLSTVPDPEPPVAGLLELACIAGPDAGRAVPLVADRPVVLGRDRTADLTVSDPHLSSRHASVRLTDHGPVATDLGSTNGLVVDGRRAATESALPMGAVARFGGSLFQARLAVEAPAGQIADGRGRILVTPGPRLRSPWVPPELPAPGPPPARTRRPLPLVAALLGAGLGVALALLTGSWLFLAFAALGPLTMLGTAASDRFAGRRGHRAAVRAHRVEVLRCRRLLAELVIADRRDDWAAHPDPAACLTRLERRSARLWERDPSTCGPARDGPAAAGDVVDGELGVVVVGVGCRPLRAAGPPELPAVTDVPVTVDLGSVRALGVVGPATERAALVRAVLLQLLALHPPGAVVVRGFALDPAPPHARAQIRDGTLVVELVDGGDGRHCEPGRGHQVTLHTATTAHQLPVDCDLVLQVGAGRLRILGSAPPARAAAATGPGSVLEPLGVAEDLLARALRAAAPLARRGAEHPAPPVDDVVDRWTPDRWSRPSATAVLGVGPAGPVSLDLDADGPHLLVAGTTGSGKSELLLALVAGLAAAAPPSDTSMLLIDYKGGAGFAAAADLPHVTAVLTDLDASSARRGLTGLRAELRRRERILAAAGAPDLAALRTVGAPGVPARLVIVVDEFATLAAELPDFLTGLVDVAQRGRSLGLHLVLATQRPGGVVGPTIRANLSARICLRVVDEAESRDVVGIPDAAWLDARRPGGAWLRIAGAAPVPLQVGRVTEPVRTTIRVRRAAEPRKGEHRAAATTGPTEPDDADPPATPLARLVLATRAAAAESAPAAPWLPALPETVTVADPSVLAVLDLPDGQLQPPLPAPATLLVAGPSGSGRSTALVRWAMAALDSGSELVLIDPAGALGDLAGIARTRLDLTEPGLVLRLLELLTARVSAAETVGRTPADPVAPVALVVDGVESLAAALDRWDPGLWQAQLADLMGRGPARGVRVAIAGGAGLLHHRLAAATTDPVLLGGPDDHGRPAPGAPPGRGRLRGTGPELQMALPGPVPVGRALPRSGDLVVRALPRRVRRADLAATAGMPRPDRIPLGVGGDAADPVTVDLTGTTGLLVLGPARSGVSTTVGTVVQGAAAAGIPSIELRDDVRGQAGTIDQVRRRLAGHDGPLVLAVDAGTHALADGSGELAHLLLTFLEVAVPGQVVVLGARTEAALRGSGRGPLGCLLGQRRVLLLQPEPADARFLGARPPRVPAPHRPGRGLLADAGVTIAVQIAIPDPLDPRSDAGHLNS